MAAQPEVDVLGGAVHADLVAGLDDACPEREKRGEEEKREGEGERERESLELRANREEN